MSLERGLYQIRPFGICSCDSGWKCNQSRGIISLMILQLFAWRLMTFLPCLRHFTKLFTKYSEMSLIHPQVINCFWNDPYLILKVLYDLQTHKMTRKMISVFLCSSVRFNSHSLQLTATVQKSQWLCFLQLSLTEIQVWGWKEAGDFK